MKLPSLASGILLCFDAQTTCIQSIVSCFPYLTKTISPLQMSMHGLVGKSAKHLFVQLLCPRLMFARMTELVSC